ncbi:penicillin acylase family protein [Steroidobacter sp.]|uniref:penicillin acylase family protein n=1 Tax=Steroidobacter sp. TaxID=1978227 RepID=UPI001A467CD7|nr:penicillin acylase family protein [Steroidobacter sp.]MBL8265289.1 penicillin acylase family protein [Steroidobacter sp.]
MADLRAKVLLIAVAALIQSGTSAADSVPPQFTRVQPETFATGGALTSAWADFDGDGDLDLAVGFGTGDIRLYRNDKGVFTNIGPQLGLPTQGFEVRGLGWGDFDNDGDPDLFASTSARGGGMGRSGEIVASSMLFRNDSERAFVDVAKDAGVAAVGPASRQVNWIDYDNDGDLDLFVTQRFSSNRLFQNNAGKFTDVSAKVGLMDPRRTVGACWFDFDQDGDLDVFIPNQQSDKDGFYRNDGGVFKDIAVELNMHQPNRTLDEGATMCGVGDYDNDGDFDIYASAYGANLLYRNEGNGKFSEVAASEGITGKRTTVGVDWGDVNNDGLLDAFIAGYVQEGPKYRAVDRLLINRGSGVQGGRFVDVLAADSVMHGADHGAHLADYDNDGDLDIALAESYNPAGGHPLLRNDLAENLRRRSLQIQVLDSKGHATRAGSEVRLFDASGKLLGARLVSPTQGYSAQSVIPVHFGLASTAPVTVEVTFLTAAGRKKQRIENVNPAKFFGKAPLVVKQDPVPTLKERVSASQPQHDGKLKLPGLRKSVEVVRDRWGIPHIYASSTHDLFFAQGFVAAQDRMWNIELWRRNSEGKLAEVLGPKYVERDKFARVMKFRGDWDAEMRKYHPEGPVIFAAFAEGVNAAIRQAIAQNQVPVEFELSGFLPEPSWTAQTPLSRMPVWSMTRNGSSEIARALAVKSMGLSKAQDVTLTDPPTQLELPEGLDLADINPDIMNITRGANAFDYSFKPAAATVSQLPEALLPVRDINRGLGSNNWVVGGKKSTTGMPLLANDPHREVQNPALRYWVHLVAPGWNVIGATEPGMPGVTIGHNEHVAWGFTIINGDQQDVYVEHTDPQNPNRYLHKGQWHDMKIDVEQIAVKGAAPVRFEVKTTRHGPLLHEDGARNRAYASRWTGYEIGGQGYYGSFGLMQAKNWDEFTKAAGNAWYGAHNLVYADVNGDFGYVSTGLIPKRPNWNGLFPVPGHEGKYEWDGYVPVEQLPKSRNREAGFYGSANNNVFPSVFPGVKAPDFAFEYLSPYRYERIVELLGQDRKFSLSDLQQMQGDVLTIPARSLVPLLKNARSNKPEVQAAIDQLLQWDYQVRVDSVAASIYEYWQLKLSPLVYAKKLPEAARSYNKYEMRRLIQWLQNPDRDFGADPQAERDRILVTAMEQGLENLRQLLGNDPSQWQWGKIHKAPFKHPLWTPENASLLDIPSVPRGGDLYTIMLTGSPTAKGADQDTGASISYVFDVQDWDRSVGLNTPGNESQVGSPHYGDLAEAWGRNEAFPIAFSKKKVSELSRARIVLQP